jgi:transglutaminase-like putative cysteine protease
MMEPSVVQVDDQPIAAKFFEEGAWLTDFITPGAPDILLLHSHITAGRSIQEDRCVACWDWVARQIRYSPFIAASINVGGKNDHTDDFWQTPSMCSHTKVGNCANKAFLLASLLRNELSDSNVYCVLGNLHNGHVSGHAWVEVNLHGVDYIMEATRDDVPLIPVEKAGRYEPVHYVNDRTVLAVPGRTVMTPFMACYSSWLKDYLDWSYINAGGRR